MLSFTRRVVAVGIRAEFKFYGTSVGHKGITKTNMTEQTILNRCTNFKKSPQDQREYRGLTLKNNLKVLLVSDPTSDLAAASMDVAVGHLHDPWEMPGTAHFCEHMLFLGTEKYPAENEYSKFLNANAGNSNAFTASDHTNYHFDVKPDALFPALDRFAQFFLTPQFTESATGKEVNAVDSEHQNNLKNDSWRILQIERYFSKIGHDNGKFGTGDKNTLGVDAEAKGLNPRNVLLDFHKKWYSSNIMRLAIVGKEPLDILEQYVIQLELDKIPDKNVVQTYWDEHPYGEGQLRHRVDIIPIKDSRLLKVNFPVPYLENEYKSQTDHIVSHLIGHEGEGSLLSALKQRGWVSSLTAGSSVIARGISIFTVTVDLSEQGISHVNDIIEIMFQYIGLIKRETPQKWIYEELREIEEMKFTFKDKEPPFSMVTKLSTALQRIPFEDILSHSFLMSEYRPDLYKQVVDCLTPQNMICEVIGKSLENNGPMEMEPIYGTKIRITPILDDSLRKFEVAMNTPHSELRIPERNEYIPTNFNIKPRDKEAINHPKLIYTDPYTRVWFYQDDKFNMPKMHIRANVLSPQLAYSARTGFLSTLYLYAFYDSLTEHMYNANIAEMKYHVDFSNDHFSLETNGYDEKQPNLMRNLVECLIRFDPDEKRFAVLKDNYIRSLENFEHNQPYTISQEYLNLLLSEAMWSKKQLREAGKDVTLDDLRAHKQKLLETFHVELFAHGNVTKEEALDLGKKVTQLLKDTRWTRRCVYHHEAELKKEYAIDAGVPMIYRHFQQTHQNSAVEALFQIGVQNDKEHAYLLLLLQLLRESSFNQLRTNEQLGYIVWTGGRFSGGTLGFQVIVQGPKDPDFVMSRIEAFLENERQKIAEMDQNALAVEIDAVVTKLQEKPKKLGEQQKRFWAEIESQHYNFDRREKQAEILQGISKNEILNFYDKKIRKGAPERRLVAVYVHGNDENKEVISEKVANGETNRDYNEIHCMETVRKNLTFFPRPEPKLKVPPMGVSANKI